MRVFVTGATGFIGSAVVKELIAGGHTVIGLARSEAAAKALTAAGAEPQRGTIDDVQCLRRGAAMADRVIHLAYVHNLAHVRLSGRLKIFFGGLPSQIPARFGLVINKAENRAIEALGSALAGTDRPLIVTAGIAFVSPGQIATEDTRAPLASAMPRGSEQAALALGSGGVRVSVVRLPVSVHGDGDHGFVPTLIGIARKKGASATVEGGLNRWSAVHRLDAARLFRLVSTSPGKRHRGNSAGFRCSRESTRRPRARGPTQTSAGSRHNPDSSPTSTNPAITKSEWNGFFYSSRRLRNIHAVFS